MFQDYFIYVHSLDFFSQNKSNSFYYLISMIHTVISNLVCTQLIQKKYMNWKIFSNIHGWRERLWSHKKRINRPFDCIKSWPKNRIFGFFVWCFCLPVIPQRQTSLIFFFCIWVILSDSRVYSFFFKFRKFSLRQPPLFQ